MNERRKVLVVAPEYPYPPIDGHKVRIYNLMKNLPGKWKFDYICFGPENSRSGKEVLSAKLGPACEDVEVIPDSTLERIKSKGWIASILNVFFPYETSIGEPLLSPVLTSRITELVDSGRYDLVHLCGLYISLHFDRKSNHHIPYVVDIGDCPSLLNSSFWKQEHRPLEKLKKYLSYIWADRWEKIHASKIRNIIMISDVDAEWIARNCRESKIWVMPNGVDTEYFRTNSPNRPASALLFTGVMNYAPNNDAMLFFVRDVYPRIRERIPDVTLTIAGRNPTVQLRDLAAQTPGVTMTGFVDDIRPYFNNATVYVSPLQSGAGIKNKILEAWSMGLPVVATRVSCSGIEAASDNILVAESPEAFSDQVSMLLSNAKLRAELAKNGREKAERSYSWRSRGEMLVDIFDEVVISKR